MKKIIIIGGDSRMTALKNELEQRRYTVSTLGLYENDNGNISDSDAAVLPVPTTRDRVNVYTPLTGRRIPLSAVSEAVPDNGLILTCGYTFSGRRCIDYGNTDGYALRNAVPTAEGAVMLATENTSRALFKSSVLVIGFGRVGKITADRFKAMGCDVTVSARREVHLALCESLGYKTLKTEALAQIPLCYDIIINTVDAEVIPDEAVKNIRTELLLELSTYGGFNAELAKKLGLNVLKAPGLPMRVAPQSASEILIKTVKNILENHNEE